MSIATAFEFHFSTSRIMDDGGIETHHRIVVGLSFLYISLAIANLLASCANYYSTQKQYAEQVLWVNISKSVQVVFLTMSVTILAGNIYLAIERV